MQGLQNNQTLPRTNLFLLLLLNTEILSAANRYQKRSSSEFSDPERPNGIIDCYSINLINTSTDTNFDLTSHRLNQLTENERSRRIKRCIALERQNQLLRERNSKNIIHKDHLHKHSNIMYLQKETNITTGNDASMAQKVIKASWGDTRDSSMEDHDAKETFDSTTESEPTTTTETRRSSRSYKHRIFKIQRHHRPHTSEESIVITKNPTQKLISEQNGSVPLFKQFRDISEEGSLKQLESSHVETTETYSEDYDFAGTNEIHSESKFFYRPSETIVKANVTETLSSTEKFELPQGLTNEKGNGLQTITEDTLMQKLNITQTSLQNSTATKIAGELEMGGKPEHGHISFHFEVISKPDPLKNPKVNFSIVVKTGSNESAVDDRSTIKRKLDEITEHSKPIQFQINDRKYDLDHGSARQSSLIVSNTKNESIDVPTVISALDMHHTPQNLPDNFLRKNSSFPIVDANTGTPEKNISLENLENSINPQQPLSEASNSEHRNLTTGNSTSSENSTKSDVPISLKMSHPIINYSAEEFPKSYSTVSQKQQSVENLRPNIHDKSAETSNPQLQNKTNHEKASSQTSTKPHQDNVLRNSDTNLQKITPSSYQNFSTPSEKLVFDDSDLSQQFSTQTQHHNHKTLNKEKVEFGNSTEFIQNHSIYNNPDKPKIKDQKPVSHPKSGPKLSETFSGNQSVSNKKAENSLKSLQNNVSSVGKNSDSKISLKDIKKSDDHKLHQDRIHHSKTDLFTETTSMPESRKNSDADRDHKAETVISKSSKNNNQAINSFEESPLINQHQELAISSEQPNKVLQAPSQSQGNSDQKPDAHHKWYISSEYKINSTNHQNNNREIKLLPDTDHSIPHQTHESTLSSGDLDYLGTLRIVNTQGVRFSLGNSENIFGGIKRPENSDGQRSHQKFGNYTGSRANRASSTQDHIDGNVARTSLEPAILPTEVVPEPGSQHKNLPLLVTHRNVFMNTDFLHGYHHLSEITSQTPIEKDDIAHRRQLPIANSKSAEHESKFLETHESSTPPSPYAQLPVAQHNSTVNSSETTEPTSSTNKPQFQAQETSTESEHNSLTYIKEIEELEQGYLINSTENSDEKLAPADILSCKLGASRKHPSGNAETNSLANKSFPSPRAHESFVEPEMHYDSLDHLKELKQLQKEHLKNITDLLRGTLHPSPVTDPPHRGHKVHEYVPHTTDTIHHHKKIVTPQPMPQRKPVPRLLPPPLNPNYNWKYSNELDKMYEKIYGQGLLKPTTKKPHRTTTKPTPLPKHTPPPKPVTINKTINRNVNITINLVNSDSGDSPSSENDALTVEEIQKLNTAVGEPYVIDTQNSYPYVVSTQDTNPDPYLVNAQGLHSVVFNPQIGLASDPYAIHTEDLQSGGAKSESEEKTYTALSLSQPHHHGNHTIQENNSTTPRCNKIYIVQGTNSDVLQLLGVLAKVKLNDHDDDVATSKSSIPLDIGKMIKSMNFMKGQVISDNKTFSGTIVDLLNVLKERRQQQYNSMHEGNAEVVTKKQQQAIVQMNEYIELLELLLVYLARDPDKLLDERKGAHRSNDESPYPADDPQRKFIEDQFSYVHPKILNEFIDMYKRYSKSSDPKIKQHYEGHVERQSMSRNRIDPLLSQMFNLQGASPNVLAPGSTPVMRPHPSYAPVL